ncbi:MAG: TonB-dependent receptor [Cytophagales bacterium]|nr:TonB-dependent receptor [Cytophaga sp.]
MCIGLSSKAQTYTISGTITDSESGEPIIGALISLSNQKSGTASDVNGAFSLKSSSTKDTLQIQYFGYKRYNEPVHVTKNIHLQIPLVQDISAMETVVIETNRNAAELEKTQMSTVEITSEEARLLPALGGETDMLKVLQLKPGIKNGGEGSAGLYVRGGGPDQNLFLMDGAQVYNPTHLFGFFSIFNSDAVKSIELYKGDFPPRFGGRLSSVVDVHMRNGDTSKIKVRGGIGVIASRLTIEGPFPHKKGNFIISGRRTYFDIFTRMLNRANGNNPNYDRIPDYYFWDLNGKFNYQINKKNSLSLSSYYGKDKFNFNDDLFKFDFKWGNFVNILSWNHSFNQRFSSTTSIIYSRYKYNITNSANGFNFNLQSGIQDWTIKSDFNYRLNEKHTLDFGATITTHSFLISRLNAGSDDGKITLGAGQHLYAQEYGIYLSDQYTITSRLKIQGGLRFSAFTNKVVYKGWEPRFSARYRVTERQSIKLSYARMFQYIHLASNSGASLPTDIWYPSTANVHPQISDQVAAGHQISFFHDKLFLSNEIYYKYMQHMIDFRDGAQLFVNNNLEGEFVYGKGWSYGWECYLEKKTGRTTGWIGYTLSWTWRQFDAINNGNLFPARYDRRHDISVVLMHKLTDRIFVSATWVYGTGNAISLPVGRILVQDVLDANPIVVPVYTDRNAFRMAAYHRMDLGLVYKLKPKWGEADLTFSIYNVYNRKNPYFIYFEEVKNSDGVVVAYRAKQVSLFPIIPTLTFNFRF